MLTTPPTGNPILKKEVLLGSNSQSLVIESSNFNIWSYDYADDEEIIQLLRKHGGKTYAELKAEGKWNTSY